MQFSGKKRQPRNRSSKNNKYNAKSKLIKITVFICFCLFSLFFYTYFHWVKYLVHLGKHQYYIFSHKYSIEKIISDPQYILKSNIQLTQKEHESLKFIQEIKKFGKKIYNLNQSHSYDDFTPIPRKELGWNLTIAEPLSLELKSFYFPFIGTFSYLGFFNYNLFKQWELIFKKQNYDTYNFVIGAYSTTGYFSDPVLSTYLNQNYLNLSTLILHEMAHEKLYFSDDSNFSESLASFIDEKAALLFQKKIYKNKYYPNLKHEQLYLQEYNLFIDKIEQTQKALNKVFKSNVSSQIKYQKKKNIYTQLKEELKILNKKFKLIKLDNLLSKDLNNAFLLNLKRYSPTKIGFEKLLTEKCNGNIECWFNNLAILKECNLKYRQNFIDTGILNNECN